MKLSRAFVSATKEMSTLYKSVPAPYLRKTITVGENITQAELSVCGLGFYRFWLNGQELTRGHLSPYISASDDVLDYDVYDLSGKLLTGENVLGFQLGNGAHNSYGGYVWDFDKASWRSAPKMAVCLRLTHMDGTVMELEADESFRCAPSPTISDDLRLGNATMPGWRSPAGTFPASTTGAGLLPFPWTHPWEKAWSAKRIPLSAPGSCPLCPSVPIRS